MRSLFKQRQKVWYTSIYEEEIQDKDGNDTGEYRDVYTKPILYKFTVSSTAGDSEEMPAGVMVDYERLVTSYDRDFNPKEGEMLFIDVIPVLDENGSLELNLATGEPITKPDYVIKKVLDTQKGKVAKYGISKIEG